MSRQRVIKPAFEVEKLEGTIDHTIYSYDIEYVRDEDGEIVKDSDGRKVMKSKQRNTKIVERDAGWMVYFPRGHSVHIINPDEMRRMGFLRDAELVDMNSEAEEDDIPQVGGSLKDQVQRTAAANARKARGRRAAQGSVDAGVE